MESISGIKDGLSWGAHFNRYNDDSTQPFPEWANPSQKRTLENHGVIVWDEATRHVVWLRGSQPLESRRRIIKSLSFVIDRREKE